MPERYLDDGGSLDPVPEPGERTGAARVADKIRSLYASAFEAGALRALDYITDERPDLEDLTMRVAEEIGADIDEMLGRAHA